MQIRPILSSGYINPYKNQNIVKRNTTQFSTDASFYKDLYVNNISFCASGEIEDKRLKMKSFEDFLKKDKRFSKDDIRKVLRWVNKDNVELGLMLIQDDEFDAKKLFMVLGKTNKENVDEKIRFYHFLRENREKFGSDYDNILKFINPKNSSFVYKMLEDGDFSLESVEKILIAADKKTSPLINKMLNNKEFNQNIILDILSNINADADNIEFADCLISNPDFDKTYIASTICTQSGSVTKTRRSLYEYIKDRKGVLKKDYPSCLKVIRWAYGKDELLLAKRLICDPRFPKEKLEEVLMGGCTGNINHQVKMYDFIQSSDEFKDNYSAVLPVVLKTASKENNEFKIKLYNYIKQFKDGSDCDNPILTLVIGRTTKDNFDVMKRIFDSARENKEKFGEDYKDTLIPIFNKISYLNNADNKKIENSFNEYLRSEKLNTSEVLKEIAGVFLIKLQIRS